MPRRRVPECHERTMVISVEVTVTEAEALRDAAFTCTSPDPSRHQAGRRALEKIRAQAERCHPRPPLPF